MDFFYMVFGIVLFFIFLIIVVQFNFVVLFFIIIFLVFFSMIGVFLGYVFGGCDIFVIFIGVGIIFLAGVVVNNVIVLIDFMNILVDCKQKELGYLKN